ncbi:DUF4105 domain-containing protein [uncultured Treponema sp.]|uniref:Lnb N-terminal periplasmic domain-containing protein n=1 Tax=uncultured Treponema sp. TaxID=162155 RepID=UPI0025D43445|nr:DUF4105 domain-containing protein [uncultured Treponema sp.]
MISIKWKNRRIILFCLFFFLSSFSFSQNLDFTDEYNARTEQLVEKARKINLHNEKTWHILLQYQKSFSGYKSIILPKSFFIAENGRFDPEAELIADIRAFRNAERVAEFPARWKWIRNHLAENESDFPESYDSEFLAIKAEANPTSVHVVYPAGFMQNPASMFGHTFILFGNDKKSRLMGHTLTYSARNTENPGLIFALKGLFGIYRSEYVINSYSEQILKYSNMDKRDIWEYKLKIDEDGIDTLLRCAIELSASYSRYLYISRNCTTGLMMLLENAFPNENLTKKLGTMAEPVEALKILWEKELISEPVFRPSIHTEILSERRELKDQAKKAVLRYCKGKISIEELLSACSDDKEKAVALKLATDYMKYQLSSGKMTQADYRKRMMPAFSAMSKLKFDLPAISSNDYPHESHDSHKIAVSGGFDQDKKEAFSSIKLRLVNHDLIDEEKGLNKNTQLDFLTATISVYPTREGLKKISVDKVLFSDILSLPVSDAWFINKAFELVSGMERSKCSEDSDSLAFRFKVFSGISTKIFDSNQVYLLAGLDFYAHPDYDMKIDPLPGAEVGLITTAGRWKQNIFALAEQGIFKNDGTKGRDAFISTEELKSRDRLRLSLSAEERLTLTRNTALSAKWTFSGDYKSFAHKGEICAHINF